MAGKGVCPPFLRAALTPQDIYGQMKRNVNLNAPK